MDVFLGEKKIQIQVVEKTNIDRKKVQRPIKRVCEMLDVLLMAEARSG